jgi:hypothetical protein
MKDYTSSNILTGKYNTFIDKIMEILNRDDRIQELIKENEKKTPEKLARQNEIARARF